MTFTRNRSLVAALVATSCLALTASASADSLPSTYNSDAAQAGYAGTRTATGSADTLPSTYKSDAAQTGYAHALTASADTLPSTHKSDAAQAGYASMLTATGSADTLPSTYKSDAAQAGYPGTRVDHPGATRAAMAAPTTIEVVRPERTIVREVNEPLPLILSSIALLFVLVGLAVVLIRTRMAPRPGH
jgi:hypothetical protein